MRGLTREERFMLSAPADLAVWTESESLLLRQMRIAGRMSMNPAPDDPEVDRYLPTDLGLLAIRVCPVDE